ncbi:MAG: hypothetical protein Q8P71_00920 [bacterium]|nr:hypothetical protein [bacterium]
MQNKPRKKVIDVRSPGGSSTRFKSWQWQSPSESIAKEGSYRSYKKYIILLSALLLVGGILTIHVLAEADVIAIYKTREVAFEQQVLLKEELAVLEIEREWIEEVSHKVSGKSEKESSAEGVIRVLNNSSSDQTLVATTRFMSEGGKLFRSLERIIVPASRKEGGKMVPGHKDVRVRAAETGESYNISASSFSIPGLSTSPLYTQIYGESSQPMKGGAKEHVSVVLLQDMEIAKQKTLDKARVQAKLLLIENDVPPEYSLLLPTLFFKEDSVTFSHDEGDATEEILVQVKVTLKGFIALTKDVHELAQSILQEEMTGGELLYQDSLSVLFAEGSEKDSILLSGQGLAYQEVSQREITSLLAGTGIEGAIKKLSDHPYLKSADISISPFWRSTLPKNEERIHVRLSF